MRYLPDWFPGAGFKRTAKQWRALFDDTSKAFFERAVDTGLWASDVPTSTAEPLPLISPMRDEDVWLPTLWRRMPRFRKWKNSSDGVALPYSLVCNILNHPKYGLPNRALVVGTHTVGFVLTPVTLQAQTIPGIFCHRLPFPGDDDVPGCMRESPGRALANVGGRSLADHE